MFDKDFYPTPPEVVNQMLMGINVAGKTILEPSAGKGNIVDVLLERGAAVLSYERNPDLAKIVADKSRLVGHDFLECTPEKVSHIDMIVMNPPFSTGERHILHAWEVAPEGCHIISLAPTQMVSGEAVSRRRGQLGRLISDYGDASIELGDCFAKAERKTGVEVSVVHLFKPVVSEDFDYEGFFMDAEEEDYPEGLIRYNEVRNVVSRYVGALRVFDDFEKVSGRMEELVAPIGLTDGFEFKFSYNEAVTTKEEFAKELQKRAWAHIFRKMDMERFVTSGVMSDINKFVETQSRYPFTMKNIYRMIQIIISGRGNIMERALVEAFDSITQYYHENRYFVEGWKTNSHYMINRKFILPHVVEEGFSGNMNFTWGNTNADRISDLNKALCFLSGRDNGLGNLSSFQKDENGDPIQFHTWYEWGFLRIKGFKKGTLHCEFLDERVWEAFNRRVAEIKGHPLPENVSLV